MRTWLLFGHKAGDNTQLLALAEGLARPFEIRRLRYRPTELVSNLTLGSTLLGVRRRGSDELAAPWPDLVLTAGRRNEPVARWIKARSGARIVHVGRPWSALQHWDLIVTTPQYALRPSPNVLVNEAPLHRVTAARLAEARRAWAPTLAGRPRPHVAVILGGHSGPYTFDREAGATLGHHARRVAGLGTILATTSARTPAIAADAFAAMMGWDDLLHRWRPDDPDNPYLGFLADADVIIVTGDSMSMLVEAVATAKPVAIFDLGRTHRPARPADVAATTLAERACNLRMQPMWFALGQRFGPRQLRRDVGAIHRAMIESRRATWLGQALPVSGSAPPLRDLERVIARVLALAAS